MTMVEANQAKAEGMAAVEANANEQWMILMQALVRRVAVHRETFTSDDVFDLLDALGAGWPSTPDRRAFGPVMVRAAKAAVCRRTDRTIPSRRRTLHASPRAVWESLVYQP